MRSPGKNTLSVDLHLVARILATKKKPNTHLINHRADTEALGALVSCFTMEKEGRGKQGHLAYRNLLSKQLVLGTLLDRPAAQKENDPLPTDVRHTYLMDQLDVLDLLKKRNNDL